MKFKEVLEHKKFLEEHQKDIDLLNVMMEEQNRGAVGVRVGGAEPHLWEERTPNNIMCYSQFVKRQNSNMNFAPVRERVKKKDEIE